jgi:hypothetical protein
VFRSESKQLEAVSSGASGSETLRKEALFQLYREKIHQDTLEIRTRLYDAV